MKQLPMTISSCKECPYREGKRLDTWDEYHRCRLFQIEVPIDGSISPDCKLKEYID